MRVVIRPVRWPNPGLIIGICGSVVLLNLAARTVGAFAWWANFILFAGLGLFAVRPFVPSSDLVWRALLRDALASAGILTLVLGATLLFELYQLVWMPMLLASGGALIFQSLAYLRRNPSPAGRAWAQSLLWAGGIAATLGLAFLVAHWQMIQFPPWLAESRWWDGVTILLGLGAYVNAHRAARRSKEAAAPAPILASIGLAIMLVGVLDMFSPW